MSDRRWRPSHQPLESWNVPFGPAGSPPPPSNTRGLYGGTVLVGPGKGGTLVAAPGTATPEPYALEVLFSANGTDYTETTPVTVNIVVTRGLDEMSGLVRNVYTVGAGEAFPVCHLVGRNITITVDPPESGLYVAAVLTPVSSISCPSTNTEPTVVQARTFSAFHEEYFDTTSPGIAPPNHGTVAANPQRSSLYISNQSVSSNLMISLGGTATYPPVGVNQGSFVLPPGGTWEMPPGFVGAVTFQVDAGSVGFVTWGEGSYS